MQEILPTAPVAGATSPALLGELSRRLRSGSWCRTRAPTARGWWGTPAVRRCEASLRPARCGTTRALPCRACRRRRPRFARRHRPRCCPPGRARCRRLLRAAGCATRTFSRHSVFAVNVVSQPMGLCTLPWWSSFTFHSAPRDVSDTMRSPSSSNARPLANSVCEPAAFAVLRVSGITVIVPGAGCARRVPHRRRRRRPGSPRSRWAGCESFLAVCDHRQRARACGRAYLPDPALPGRPPSLTHRLPSRRTRRHSRPERRMRRDRPCGGVVAAGTKR